MPKKSNKSQWRGRIGTTGDSKQDFYVHDDRVPRTQDTEMKSYNSTRPRVSFKNQSHSRNDRRASKKNWGAAIKSVLDDDVTMGSASDGPMRSVVFRERGRGPRGRSSPVTRGSRVPIPRARTIVGEANWYKVTIPFGNKYEKEFIISNLLSLIAPETFVPMMYKANQQESSFYIDEHKIANKLLTCDRRITTADGFKISVRVRPGFPQCDVDNVLKEKIKLAMAKRFVLETNALDLSRFHLDPELAPDYFCALFRPSMLMAVLDIAAENIPHLAALNLDNNKLGIIERLNVLTNKFPDLKILHIGDNKIREINQIDVIKDLKLEELRLAGNPVCNRYKTRQDDYVSDVRKRFPKLLRLDGTELPPAIVFDVADELNKLPPSQRVFINNPKAQEVANQFLQQYFMVFDSESRQPLLNAYHEQACFSLTVPPSPAINKFSAYTSESRNILRSSDVTRRQKLLKRGRLPVVSFISEMPKTQHFLHTFSMDIPFVTDTMMTITVTGCFKETVAKDNPIRYFNRTFTIVPEGSGYCIKNEQVHLFPPTSSQEKEALNQVVPTQPCPQPVPSTSMPATIEPSDEIKQQMTVTLSQQTNMNLEWSHKCLKEVQWNFDNALAAFQEFFKLGRIPPDAFKK